MAATLLQLVFFVLSESPRTNDIQFTMTQNIKSSQPHIGEARPRGGFTLLLEN